MLRESSDSRCVFQLDRLDSSVWLLHNPVIPDLAALHDSGWQAYLSHLYPDLVESLPIDTRCFTFFWTANAAMMPVTLRETLARQHTFRVGQRPLRLPRMGEVFVPPGKAEWRPENAPGVMANVLNEGRPRDRRRSREAWWLPVLRQPAGFASHTRVEVYHDGSDCTPDDSTGGAAAIGYWMYLAPGSGIWFNLGRTLAFNGTYAAACRGLAAAEDARTGVCSECCGVVHRTMVREARAAGIDSLQILGSAPGDGMARFVEIVDTNSDCDARDWRARGGRRRGRRRRRLSPCADPHAHDSGACPPHGHLSVGRARASPCHCNTSAPHVNCDLTCPQHEGSRVH